MDHRRVCGRYKMEGAILRGVCASSSAPRSSLDPCEVVPLQRHALVLREIVAREERLDVRERRLFAVVVSLLAARRRDAMRSRADCGTAGFAV